ncbi:MAG: hypothetical protein HGB35_08930 [Geobacteraceae bacterium]|nr:hypothetical protein [Geobacteraceae bacterium]
MTHTDKAAWRKVGEIDGWEMCIIEAVTGGMFITGGIPRMVGNKKKWPAKKQMDRILLTRADVEAEESRYELETGGCYVCYGTGQETAGWSAAEGVRYRECTRCMGVGRVS